MRIDALIKLAASGNIRSVEEGWLSWLEEANSQEDWQEGARLLKALGDKDAAEPAEAMATTAIEMLSTNADESAALPAACTFLLTLKNSTGLRKTTADLYRTLHGDVEGLEELLAEAGVEVGRPPRRALRTMDVCIGLTEGQCLTHRHEDSAVKVLEIDRAAWLIKVTDGSREYTHGAVEFADNYMLADADDFSVMAQFDTERLSKQLNDQPGEVITGLIRSNGTSMNSDELKAMLSPRFIAAKNWSKWWTKARAALRLCPNIKIEGRTPYYLTWDPHADSFEEDTRRKLVTAHDPVKELAIVEEYAKGCGPRGLTVNEKLLANARDRIEDRARREMASGGRPDLTPWLAARRIGTLLGDEQAQQHVVQALSIAKDPVAAILAVENPAYWPDACAALEEAHPDNLREGLETLLPHAPIAVANNLSKSLVGLGCTRERFEQLGDQILRAPVEQNEGLLWLWSEPRVDDAKVSIPRATIFSRMLLALGELKRRENLTRSRVRQIAQNTREALRARRFESFRKMLDEIDTPVAAAMRTELTRLDNIGRASEDMITLLDRRFPELTAPTASLRRWEQEDVLYVTAPGMSRKRSEIEELINVKIRENSVAIGAAAEHGDLSENSEYKFALEERDLLHARLNQLQSEMAKAKVISASDVPDNYVGIGCRAVLEHADGGTRHEVVILSPWEADPEQRVYNYLTPLAKCILGTSLGELTEVEYFDPPGSYRVVELASALVS